METLSTNVHTHRNNGMLNVEYLGPVTIENGVIVPKLSSKRLPPLTIQASEMIFLDFEDSMLPKLDLKRRDSYESQCSDDGSVASSPPIFRTLLPEVNSSCSSHDRNLSSTRLSEEGEREQQINMIARQLSSESGSSNTFYTDSHCIDHFVTMSDNTALTKHKHNTKNIPDVFPDSQTQLGDNYCITDISNNTMDYDLPQMQPLSLEAIDNILSLQNCNGGDKSPNKSFVPVRNHEYCNSTISSTSIIPHQDYEDISDHRLPIPVEEFSREMMRKAKESLSETLLHRERK